MTKQKTPEIISDLIYPPIPHRRFDWCAYYDGEEELGQYGYGVTEKRAVIKAATKKLRNWRNPSEREARKQHSSQQMAAEYRL